MKLTYEVPKTVKGQKKWYENAYFAWVKFSLDAAEIEGLEKEVKNFESMLRYLLIKTVAEDTMAPAHLTAPKEARRATKDEDGIAPVEAVAAEVAPEVEAKEDKSEEK
jgi:ribosomal protein S6